MVTTHVVALLKNTDMTNQIFSLFLEICTFRFFVRYMCFKISLASEY